MAEAYIASNASSNSFVPKIAIKELLAYTTTRLLPTRKTCITFWLQVLLLHRNLKKDKISESCEKPRGTKQY